MQPVRPVCLADAVVELRPLTLDHVDAIARAASVRDTYGLTLVPEGEAGARAFIEAGLADQARGVSLPFATFDVRAGRIVGSTRFMCIERWTWPPPGSPLQRAPENPDVVEIGSTWLAAEAQRTAINTHAKLLMLRHAFEAWEVRRVMLKTDARNVRSRRAIERIGARFDGVLRAHMPAFDGGVRDTAFYSILASEWPEVRAALETKAGSAPRR
jgi:RimJ/RimL family protein N-acetyltransferase